jgi:Ca-activated chloride channel family protein
MRLLLLWTGLALGIPSAAGDPQVALTPRPRYKPGGPGPLQVDVNLTLVPVTVTDPLGAPYTGLRREAFRLWEDGVEQQLKYFAMQEAPISLGVVFDASRSMEGKLEQSRAAVSRFFLTGRPGDEYFVIEFNDAPRVLCSFTGDTERIEKSLAGVRPQNWTALFDAVYMAIRQMKHAKHQRKALLILSDGADNASRYSESEMKSLVREADVCIYSLALGGGALIKAPVGPLKRLAQETGGIFRRVDRIADLPDAVARINAAIRNQYLLGYSSGNPRKDGLYRRIEVRLNPDPNLPPLHATWRAGYYAPAGP